MLVFSTILLIIIFVFLSGLHIYWAAGGRWASDGVFPTKSDNTVIPMPGVIPTLIVSLGLLIFGVFVLLHIVEFTLPFGHDLAYNYGLWIISIIFILRAVGDFRYVGFFKKIRYTKFGIKDTTIYSPLCLFIGILSLIIIFIKV